MPKRAQASTIYTSQLHLKVVPPLYLQASLYSEDTKGAGASANTHLVTSAYNPIYLQRLLKEENARQKYEVEVGCLSA